MSHAEQFARTWAAVRPSLLQFAGRLDAPLTPADGGRMFLAAAVLALGSELSPAEIAEALRSMADQIDTPTATAH